VEVKLNKGSTGLVKTKVIDNEPNPVWKHQDSIDVKIKASEAHQVSALISVYDYDYTSNDFLGYLEINLSAILKESGSWINEIY